MGQARLRDRSGSRLFQGVFMDINYLYYRQQVSQFMADTAACVEARRAHQGLADGYSVWIADAKAPEPPEA